MLPLDSGSRFLEIRGAYNFQHPLAPNSATVAAGWFQALARPSSQLVTRGDAMFELAQQSSLLRDADLLQHDLNSRGGLTRQIKCSTAGLFLRNLMSNAQHTRANDACVHVWAWD